MTNNENENKHESKQWLNIRLLNHCTDNCIPIPKNKPRIPKPPKWNTMFGSQMLDDSMSPEFNKDEIALIYPQFTPENEDIVMAYYDGQLYVRKYCLSGGTITLTPLNRRYETFQDNSSKFDIYGVVKDKIAK